MSGLPNYTGTSAYYGVNFVSGSKTVTTAGTAVQITATSTPILGIWVGADTSGGPVVVGDSNVDAANGQMAGIVLYPANQSIFLSITDLSYLWLDARSNGFELCYTYLIPVSGPTG